MLRKISNFINTKRRKDEKLDPELEKLGKLKEKKLTKEDEKLSIVELYDIDGIVVYVSDDDFVSTEWYEEKYSSNVVLLIKFRKGLEEDYLESHNYMSKFRTKLRYVNERYHLLIQGKQKDMIEVAVSIMNKCYSDSSFVIPYVLDAFINTIKEVPIILYEGETLSGDLENYGFDTNEVNVFGLDARQAVTQAYQKSIKNDTLEILEVDNLTRATVYDEYLKDIFTEEDLLDLTKVRFLISAICDDKHSDFLSGLELKTMDLYVGIFESPYMVFDMYVEDFNKLPLDYLYRSPNMKELLQDNYYQHFGKSIFSVTVSEEEDNTPEESNDPYEDIDEYV